MRVTNFKSIGEGPNKEAGINIELKPLTFLVGPNGGGKSSILDAIALASEGGRVRLLAEFSDRDLPFRQRLNSPCVVTLTLEPRVIMPSYQIPLIYQFSYAVSETGSRSDEKFGNDSQLDFPKKDEDRRLIARLNERLKVRRDLALIRGTRGDLSRGSRLGEGGVPTWWAGDREIIDENKSWVGPYGEDLLALLALIFGKREHEDVKNQITKAVQGFGVSRVAAGWWGQPTTGSDYEDPALEVTLRTVSASLGGRQALTVITQICWCRPGGLTMVEEPEISLHPAAQVEMCRFLATQASKGKQILATTHSPFMLLALRKPILEETIAAEDVAIYHVERNQDSQAGEIGATVAKRLPLAKEGYLEEWVPSFSKVERDLAKEWTQAVGRVEKAGTTVRRTRRKGA